MWKLRLESVNLTVSQWNTKHTLQIGDLEFEDMAGFRKEKIPTPAIRRVPAILRDFHAWAEGLKTRISLDSNVYPDWTPAA